MEHIEVTVDNAVVLLEVPVAARQEVLDIAGAQPPLAVRMGDSRIPAVWLAQMVQVGLIGFEDVVNDLGIVVEVGCEEFAEVVHLEQAGPMVGQGEGLEVVVEQLAGAE